MAIVHKMFSALILALLSQSALALPDWRSEMIVTDPLPSTSHSCFSYTVTSSTLPHYCPYFNATKCGPTPDCIILEKREITVPCKNSQCPHTPTITVREPSPCPTCQTGCGTEIMIITTTTGCLTSNSTSTITIPTPTATYT